MIKFLFDYDNTILNCDSEYIWNKILDKILIFKKNKVNIFFYKLYNNKIINNNCFCNFLKKNYFKVKKIKIIYNYIIKIFNNKNFFYKKSISTTTNFILIKNKKKIFNCYCYCNNYKIINFNYKKILNFKKKKNIFISDSINDIFFFFFNKKNIIYNSDKFLYFLNNIILNNNIY
ncbi:hypothetical protein [Candidatus Carsonella ruddii]|uniref:Uncharacterized protein n=1 Tax=Candidatus Carsonella ruddii HC isolate Thao2000 TaxID=1202538 RepID=J3TE73_CARRU|nr:hypothetical protein [Candidatus Carsonella ruddii]AFP83887.1 hypothetical protein A353_033 [Candidatus Carsonella ruddii HC isolate Thao2000]